MAGRNDISLQVLKEIRSDGKGNIPGHAMENVILGSVTGGVAEAKTGEDLRKGELEVPQKVLFSL